MLWVGRGLSDFRPALILLKNTVFLRSRGLTESRQCGEIHHHKEDNAKTVEIGNTVITGRV